VTPGTGGKVTGTGGNATGTGGASAGGATGLGTGGSSGATGGRDAGASGGRVSDGAVGTGGKTGDGGSGGTSADGGGSGVASSGCGKNTAKPNRKTQQTISIGGTTRYYLLNVPTNADANTPLPLVLALHGYDMNNVALVDAYDFTTESGNKAITALPQGEGPEPGTTSHWGDQVLKSTWSGNTANYDFMQQLVADLEGKYCIDTSRVFITGFSMGGMFTNSIACDHNDWFRGFAPVEGGGPGSCSHADAKPAIIIHQGTADTTATPAKGGEPTRDFWIKQNGCNTTTTAMYTGCQSYGACSDPVLYCVGNWGHSVDRIARANIWKFFDSLK
jgi:poly(3-hydroxybutyrate) depolymerase